MPVLPSSLLPEAHSLAPPHKVRDVDPARAVDKDKAVGKVRAAHEAPR